MTSTWRCPPAPFSAYSKLDGRGVAGDGTEHIGEVVPRGSLLGEVGALHPVEAEPAAGAGSLVGQLGRAGVVGGQVVLSRRCGVSLSASWPNGHLTDRSRDSKSPTGPRCVSLSGLTIELMLLI